MAASITVQSMPPPPSPSATLGKQCCESGSGSGSVGSIFFGPPGSGSGSCYHQAKIVRKTLIPTVLWNLFDFLSLKNDGNVPSKSNKLKNILIKKISFFGNLKVIPDRDPHQNVMDPQHCWQRRRGHLTIALRLRFFSRVFHEEKPVFDGGACSTRACVARRSRIPSPRDGYRGYSRSWRRQASSQSKITSFIT